MVRTVSYKGHQVEAVTNGRREAVHIAMRWVGRAQRVKPLRALLVLLASAAGLSACASLVPLREPPPLAAEEPPGNAKTRDEAIARFGPPDELRASDIGQVLVYRRTVVIENNPNRYYGIDRGARLNRYERVLLYLDGEGRIVRWTTEPE